MTNEGLELIKRYEGFRAKPYLCPAGVPTIGYGITVYPDGTKVTLQDSPITQAKALAMLKTELQKYEDAVDDATGGVAADYELAAMTSLAYNIGVAAFKGSSVCKLYNAGKLGKAAAAFGLWNKIRVNGELVVSPGLVARRAAEAAMFRNASTDGSMPQEVEPPLPLAQSRTMVGTVTAATGTVATVGAGVQAVSDLKTSVEGLGPWFPYILGIGAVALVIGLVCVAYARWDDKRKGLR